MGSAAVTQADHLPSTQEVHLFRHNAALAVSRSQAITTVQSKHIHLGVGRGRGRRENMHCGSVISRVKQSKTPVGRVGNRSHVGLGRLNFNPFTHHSNSSDAKKVMGNLFTLLLESLGNNTSLHNQHSKLCFTANKLFYDL